MNMLFAIFIRDMFFLSCMFNHLKTAVLLAALSALVLFVGFLLGGNAGLTIALILAVLMNFGMLFYSHKLVIAMYHAKPAKKSEYPQLHSMIETLAHKMQLPKPQIFIVPNPTPNAFATGPSPRKAVVACTEGILKLLSKDELEGVLAHEMSHVKNRDMLVTTVAATMAAVISYVASMAQFAALFGGFGRDNEGQNIVGLLVLAILTPIIAAILQLAISRSREYLADATGAKTLKDGKHLASALQKIENSVKHHPMRGNATMSSLFIVNPFRAQNFAALFSTHPRTEERVKRLHEMKF